MKIKDRIEFICVGLGIPWIHWGLIILAVIIIALLAGCAGLENHDDDWNKVRQPYLAGPGWAID